MNRSGSKSFTSPAKFEACVWGTYTPLLHARQALRAAVLGKRPDFSTAGLHLAYLLHQTGRIKDQAGWRMKTALREVIVGYGLPMALYSDRAGWAFRTPTAKGPVDKKRLTQVGRALAQLGVEHIPAYSPQARGRSERAFQTHQGRLPQELARAGITTMQAANHYLEHTYREAHNREFGVPSTLQGTAYVPFLSGGLPDILCEHHERTVGNDNCVSFENMKLQIPAGPTRPHYVKTKVRVHRYVDGTMALFHGPRRLDAYDRDLAELRAGQTVEVTSSSLPGKKLSAAIKFIDPNLNDFIIDRLQRRFDEELHKQGDFERSLAATKAALETLAPQTILLSRSRPSSSVPRGCWRLGGLSRE